MTPPRITVLMWPDAFEDWYGPLGVDRSDYLAGYDREWLHPFAAALTAAGAQVTVVHASLAGSGTGRQVGSGARVVFVGATWAYRGLRRAVWGHRHWERAQVVWPVAPYLSTASPALLRELARGRPDAVVVQDYESARFEVATPVLAALRLRVVGLDTGGSSRPRATRRRRWAQRRAAALLATHSAEALRVRAATGHTTVAAWPAPLRPEMLASGDRAAARARLGLDRERPLVLAVGRLHAVKGLDDLLAAARGLDADVALVGTGPEEERLRALGGARLIGAVTTAELADWYAAATVVALASHQEGMPLTVLEALAAGRAVVATDVGGVADAVRDGETGWLVPARDPGALRAALAAATADQAEADRRGAAGAAAVRARHAPGAAGAELLRLILGGR